MENRNKDDIRYAEYFIRKTIQPYSLRAKRTNPSENICFRKNLTLFLNKQTAHLRDGKGKDASIRELFQNTNTESIPIFPTVIPKMEKKMVNHRSTQSLNMKDPNGWIFRKVEDYLNNQQCHDFIYAETPPSTIAVKKEEEGEKPLPPEEEIEQAILDAIKEKDMTKYFTTFYNKMQVHKLRQYRSQSDKKDSGIQTFFTDLKEDPSSPKKQKSSFFSQSNSSNFIKIKDVFEKNEKELDKAILDEICAENNLTTEKLLGIGDIVNEGKPLKSIPTEPKEEDDTDVIEMAQVETYKEKRELSRFKKKNLKPGENIYKTHFKNNQLYSNEQNAKLHSMKLEQKRMMESVEHPKSN